MERQIEEYMFLQDVITGVEEWQEYMSTGKRKAIEEYQGYDKKVWHKVRNKIAELENKRERTKIDEEFLKVKYVGMVHRVLRYSEGRGQVYPTNSYQSWSKKHDILSSLTNLYDVVNIRGYVEPKYYAIDINRLLIFYYKNIKRCNQWDGGYKGEEEVLMPMYKGSVLEITRETLEYDKGEMKREQLGEIPRERWFRKRM